MKPIAYIHTDLPEKFGIPRQSGLVKELKGKIIFEPEYRSMDAVKGLEGFNYIWLLWEFQGVDRSHFNATVRPPRLGGNTRVGVFATRSPFRPNPIGLSSVHLDAVKETEKGPVLEVSGGRQFMTSNRICPMQTVIRTRGMALPKKRWIIMWRL